MSTYVAYLIAPARRGEKQLAHSNQELQKQRQSIADYLAKHDSSAHVLEYCVEIDDKKIHRNQWPALHKALELAYENRAHVIFSKIGGLTGTASFTNPIRDFIARTNNVLNSMEIICCDHLYLNRMNFVSMAEHARQQRKAHGELIKQGLQKAHSKSGNPHAAELITKVNKPKIDNAVLFAFILHPLIQNFRRQRLSQRKIVATLNEQGFPAPEGGQWVLSQFQKVLNRVRVNESAIEVRPVLQQAQQQGLSSIQVAQKLNELGIPNPLADEWNLESVTKISERLHQIDELQAFLEFVQRHASLLSQKPFAEQDGEHLIATLERTGATLA